jgi:ribosomal protein S18 acetylase RimI-like enzyme
MIHIRTATTKDVALITEIARSTFLETYASSTPIEALKSFMEKAFHPNTLTAELNAPHMHYFLIFKEEKLAGYAKIELNIPKETIDATQLTKLDRIYIRKKYYGQKLGTRLFNHIVEFSKTQQQQGMWLYVLISNKRALQFYTLNNFQIVANYSFKVSETQYNPNYILFLRY